ncbi:DUF2987 domain-containing protein [Pseudoalteromonas denitrificans]|uniref:DUF2987 domain-containing protein n=1 Tax=Pseudoalteromonas denitrificans DSM 6059 TaxID=1123010 RepID=A0A1I1NUV9_9GAMM|nr:DUF2987 domain-containing protein [Pseudoalteromonas denitrificans]SFD01102.1 Protein of unknown function [Pseudoalteromonas denitrificans DSM 6059]
MNKQFFILVCSSVLVFSSFLSSAKEFVVAYDGFYDRMKVVNKGEYNRAKVGFYLKELKSGKSCILSHGQIITEQQEFPLTFSPNMELLLPFDEKLDKDKAIVIAQTQNPKDECQLVMQIEASGSDKTQLAKNDLFEVYTELSDLMDDLSGFVLSTVFGFLMPDIVGITLIFDEPVTLLSKNESVMNCSDFKCKVVINDDWEDDMQTIRFSSAPSKIVPFIEK